MNKFYKVESGVALDVPIPYEIQGLSREDLADLSFTPPELGLQGAAWWPESVVEQSLAIGEEFTDEIILTLDVLNKEVEVRKGVRAWNLSETTIYLDSLAEGINMAVVEATAKATRFSLEYTRREDQARKFIAQVEALPKDAEIPPAPRLIANFAESAGMNEVDAAKLTISQADDLYEKQDCLADLRMRKYEMLRAPDLAAALAIAADINQKIEAIAITIQ